MKIYLKSIVKQLSNFSDTLNKTSILIDKPWAVIDDEFEMQKLIFKKNKELILSKNGQVQIGKWDYFPEAKSLLIDRVYDKILCNEAFIDKGVMILRLDGTSSRFFVLANENEVPDLDVNKYLKNLRYQKLNILESKLVDGKVLEIQQYSGDFQIGTPVTIEAETTEDGKYELLENNQYIEIKNGRISKILTEKKYTTPEGLEIVIQQQSNERVTKGDYVFMFEQPINNAVINFTKFKNLVVSGGVVVRKEWKSKYLRWLS